jgi:hypothetical protein
MPAGCTDAGCSGPYVAVAADSLIADRHQRRLVKAGFAPVKDLHLLVDDDRMIPTKPTPGPNWPLRVNSTFSETGLDLIDRIHDYLKGRPV